MKTITLSKELYALLQSVDTPTVCNAIELAQGKRGFNNFTKSTIYAADVQLPSIVGFAKTAQIKATTPPKASPEEVKAKRMAYYEYMSSGERPSIAVIQDLDYPNPIGAYWGEINNNIHRSFGLYGVLTDGLMRDLGSLAPQFQVLASGVGVSHLFVHVVDFDTPVEVFGMQVSPNDIIHADRHGGVVIPQEIIPTLEGDYP